MRGMDFGMEVQRGKSSGEKERRSGIDNESPSIHSFCFAADELRSQGYLSASVRSREPAEPAHVINRDLMKRDIGGLRNALEALSIIGGENAFCQEICFRLSGGPFRMECRSWGPTRCIEKRGLLARRI